MICYTVQTTEGDTMEKKSAYRFNIQLNPGDPLHMTAIRTLNAQGRRKSQFIVNAILHYVMDDNAAGKAVLPDTDEIRLICREILTEMMAELPSQPVNLIKAEEPEPNPSDPEIDLGAIADTLNGFRKK